MRSSITDIINSTRMAIADITDDCGPVTSVFLAYLVWTLAFPIILALEIHLGDEPFDDDNFYHVALLLFFIAVIDLPQLIIIFCTLILVIF